MKELVHERALRLVDRSGRVFDRVLVYAEPQSGGTWAGWLEFVSAEGGIAIPSDRETTQSTLNDVAYWATGLEPIFFEGALERALRRVAESGGDIEPAQPSSGAGGVVARLSIETLDARLPLDLMATHTLVHGQRRFIHNGGVLVYEGARLAPTATEPGVYDFSAQFGSNAAAAVMANTLWTALHGRGLTLRIDGAEVPIANAALKEALVGAPVR